MRDEENAALCYEAVLAGMDVNDRPGFISGPVLWGTCRDLVEVGGLSPGLTVARSASRGDREPAADRRYREMPVARVCQFGLSMDRAVPESELRRLAP